MKRPTWIFAGIALIGAALFAAARFGNDPQGSIPHADATPQTDSPGLCPWRTPRQDMQAFFPGSTDYRQRLMILSDLQVEAHKKLGPKALIDANSFYCYRILRGSTPVGDIIAHRTPGEYGVIEYVEAFDPKGRIAGLKIQRLREPPAIAKAITSTAWLHSFDGLDENSNFSDLPPVDPAAKITAASIVDSVHRLTVEYDVAHAHGR